ncbi:NAD(P)/FAD-dependent oxidoreductase [Pigmentibacter sp. JX0631]|uniref:NAD(P)/FAD-dependent oxidoreductase n=1 Tax=Pigmentibacter sp. JX0631 TaxID=2976982 RepID=UPI002469C525|nr:NAD(P)/FAD-dependent oxidoreductase [Pigmentibacter sp. JX0631]WGL58916.1 NAD(P)/FAD-dependent oxidoreductase [Pigmentibacter sp. JX0631]
MSSNISSRRKFIKKIALASVLTASSGYALRKITAQKKELSITGSILGANAKIGHKVNTEIKDIKFSAVEKISTLIIGGGVAGLSAGWWLKKNNYKDFKILEMNAEVGGNSFYSENNISKYPWGAHYLVMPTNESIYLKILLEEMRVIKGYKNSLPIYDEFSLCADPQERLFFQGEWQEGLLPYKGVSELDKQQYKEFFTLIERLKNQKGADNKPLFAIPIDYSSQDNEYLNLDHISMAEFMHQKGWNSKTLTWYINYCCRDDFGMGYEKVSAWAGLHYFAARNGRAANAEANTVLTWPEGNGFLVNYLKKYSTESIVNNCFVTSIENFKDFCNVNVFNTKDNTYIQYQAKQVIFCAPRFIANKVIKNYEKMNLPETSSWLIANITLQNVPASLSTSMAWDNVSYYSNSLGYIVANHQSLKIPKNDLVLTYYLPLDILSAKEERMLALKRNYNDWLNILLSDLNKMHSEIKNSIKNVDFWIWGHGMAAPGIGFLWSEKRKKLMEPFGNIDFAHSEMSGISLFEEAQYRGIEAAKKVLLRG